MEKADEIFNDEELMLWMKLEKEIVREEPPEGGIEEQHRRIEEAIQNLKNFAKRKEEEEAEAERAAAGSDKPDNSP